MFVAVLWVSAVILIVHTLQVSSFHLPKSGWSFTAYPLSAMARRADVKKLRKDKLGEHTVSSIKKVYKRRAQNMAVLPKVWRISSINVPLAVDPGKDDLTVHSPLIRSVSEMIDVPVKRLSSCDIVIVKKSYDGRKRKSVSPGFTYVVDITAGPGPALKINAKAGKVELKDGNSDVNVVATNLLDFASQLRSSDADLPKVVVVGAGPAGTLSTHCYAIANVY